MAEPLALTVILPTYNERDSLPTTIDALRTVLADRTDWNVLVVDDDSPDETWRWAQEAGAIDPRILCYRRQGRRGLSSAIVDGLSMAQGVNLVVMDADMQHDPAIIPAMVAALETHPIAVGSRYITGGGTDTWSRHRLLLSRLATAACHLILGITVKDPMSGFFAIRREVFQHIASRLNPRGFKILMELLAVAKGYSVTEVPYVFRARARGLSKLSGAVVGDFAFALIELATRDLISVQFMKYASVGLTGVAVQYGSFYGLWNQVLTNPEMATSLAIGTAAIGNYLLNNLWTFRDRRHMGAMAILRGLATFLMVSSVGAYIAQALTWYGTIHHGSPLWASMGVGIIVSTVWNYAINLNCTWGGHDRPA